jgi:hypothetical protein
MTGVNYIRVFNQVVIEGQYVASPWPHVTKPHEVASYFTEI